MKTRKGDRLRSSGHISYTRVRELILQRLKKLGYDASKFGMHSFRAGGATAAVRIQESQIGCLSVMGAGVLNPQKTAT